MIGCRKPPGAITSMCISSTSRSLRLWCGTPAGMNAEPNRPTVAPRRRARSSSSLRAPRRSDRSRECGAPGRGRRAAPSSRSRSSSRRRRGSALGSRGIPASIATSQSIGRVNFMAETIDRLRDVRQSEGRTSRGASGEKLSVRSACPTCLRHPGSARPTRTRSWRDRSPPCATSSTRSIPTCSSCSTPITSITGSTTASLHSPWAWRSAPTGPALTIGRARRASDSIPVDALLARHLYHSGIAASFDLALSEEFQVDHSITVPLHFLAASDGVVERPIVPVWINGIAPPLPLASRCRELGAIVRGGWRPTHCHKGRPRRRVVRSAATSVVRTPALACHSRRPTRCGLPTSPAGCTMSESTTSLRQPRRTASALRAT